MASGPSSTACISWWTGAGRTTRAGSMIIFLLGPAQSRNRRVVEWRIEGILSSCMTLTSLSSFPSPTQSTICQTHEVHLSIRLTKCLTPEAYATRIRSSDPSSTAVKSRHSARRGIIHTDGVFRNTLVRGGGARETAQIRESVLQGDQETTHVPTRPPDGSTQ